MTRAVLPTPATPSYCAAMTVGTMVKRFAHVRFLVACLWVQPLFTLSVPCDIFRTPALIWGRFIDSGNLVGRTRSDIQAAGPRRCQSQIVLLLLGCKAGLICIYVYMYICIYAYIYMCVFVPTITQTFIYTLWQSIMASREIRELNGGVRFHQAMFDKLDVERVSHWKGPIV